MHKVICIRTFDGTVHSSLHSANKHLDSLFADEMAKVLHKHKELDKSIDFGEWVEDNLEVFASMLKIKDDYGIEDNEN